MSFLAPADSVLPRTNPRVVKDWRAVAPCSHFVQLYRSEAELIEPLAAFVSDGIWQSERVLVIATPEHRQSLAVALRERRIDLFSATPTPQLVLLDAAETLARFMSGRHPDRQLFQQTVGEMVRHAAGGGRKLRAFGEMVALLWAEGNRRGAIELEELWNELSRACRFSLFCAYPDADAADAVDGFSLQQICRAHACVIPA